MTLQHIINIDGIEPYSDNRLLLSAVVMSVYYANISTKRTENLDMCGICVNTHTHTHTPSHLTSLSRVNLSFPIKYTRAETPFFTGVFRPFPCPYLIYRQTLIS